MPHKPARPCSQPGCPAKVSGRSSYCPAHAKKQERFRGTATERGYDHNWNRLRKAFAEANPYCFVCGNPVEIVDHIIPLAQGGESEWDNLQSLCRRHHAEKSRQDGSMG